MSSFQQVLCLVGILPKVELPFWTQIPLPNVHRQTQHWDDDVHKPYIDQMILVAALDLFPR